MNLKHFAKNIFKLSGAAFIICALALPILSFAQNPTVGVFLKNKVATTDSVDFTFTVSTSDQEVGLTMKYGQVQNNLDQTTGEFWRGKSTGTKTEDVEVSVSGLTIGTTYYYQVVNTDTPATIYNENAFETALQEGQILQGNQTQSHDTCPEGNYCLLSPLPGLSAIDTKGTSFGKYLNTIFKLGIGIAGVLAVVMIVIGGIQYMSTDAISGKEGGKERMTHSIIGLLLALGAFVLLNTINPNLTIIGLSIEQQKITIDPTLIDSDAPETAPTNGKYCSAYTDKELIANVFPAPEEGALRSTLSTAPYTTNVDSSNHLICTKIGDKGCTAVQGLSNNVLTGLQKIRSQCPLCELTITGGSECWLHKSHGPGKDKIDLRNTGTTYLTAYVKSKGAGIPLTNWGTLYVVNGIEFVDEGNHYHVWGWNNDHEGAYNKK